MKLYCHQAMATLRNFHLNFRQFSWTLLVLCIFGLIAGINGRSVHTNAKQPKPQPVRKSASEPGMLFGDPSQPGSVSTYEEGSMLDASFAQDEEFFKDFISKRVVRSPLPDGIRNDDDDDEDDVDNEDKDDGEEDEEEDSESSSSTTTKPTPKVESSNSSTTTTPLSSTTKGPENVTPTPGGKPPASSPQVGTTPASRGPGKSQVPPPPPPTTGNGTAPRRPPPGLPPGAVLGKPPPGGIPLPPGAKPGPGGGRPPFQIPPHLLMRGPPTKAPPAKKGELYLPEGYSNLEVPKLDAGKYLGIKVDKLSPVPVLVFLNIRSIRDIDEDNNEIVLDLDMKVEWVDGHLFDPFRALSGKPSKQMNLNPLFLKKLWKPDIYIDELVKVHRASLMAKPHTLLFSPDSGLVSYTFRVAVRLSCEMDFFYYPSDTHQCPFHLRSYSYFDADLNLSWLRNGVYLQDPGDPNFDLQVDSIETVKVGQTFKESKNNTYDALRFTILARRKLSFHLVQTYLPSIFFIVITWLCFLVPARMVEARIGISMTTLLTLTAMFASVRESTPIVSYVKAIDIWMVFCIFFVFLTLLEFSLLVWMRATREDAEEKKIEHQRQMQEQRRSLKMGKNGRDRSPSQGSALSIASAELKRYEMIAEFTEKWAFLIFSVVFIAFNIGYWSWLLVSSDHFVWAVNATHNALEED